MPISGNIQFSNGGNLIIPDYYGVSRKSGTNILNLTGTLTGTVILRVGEVIDDQVMAYSTLADIAGVTMSWTALPVVNKAFRARGAQFILNGQAGTVCNIDWSIS